MTRERALELVRFFVSGITATAVNLILLYVLTEFAGIWYLISLAVSFLVAFGVSFFLQKFWTFANRGRERMHAEATWFFVVQVGGLSFNMLALYALVEVFGLWYMAAQFLISIVIAITNFYIFKFLIFKMK